MSVEENKALVQRTVDAFNQTDVAAVDRLFAAHYVDHDRSRAGLPAGPAGVKQAWSMFRAAFPDLQAQIEEMIAEGDKVAVRGAIRGTHQGELLGIPPTGKPVAVTLIDLNRIEGSQLVERWAEADMLGLLQQLGVIPAPAPVAGASASLASAPGAIAGDSPPAPEAAKALVRRFYDEFISAGRAEVVDALLAPTYRYHAPGMELRGPEAMKGLFAMLRAAFPDWRETIEDVLAEGDKVVLRVTGHGTHQGEFMGLPATDRPVAVGGLDIVRVAGGRLAEHWAVFDNLGLLQQIGAMPAASG